MRIAHLFGGLALVALACSSESTAPAPAPTVASISITPVTVDTLFSIGETAQLSAVAKDASGAAVSGATVSYQSSAQGVAAVSPTGLVTAVANGTAVVTASSGPVSSTVPVRVRQKLSRVVLAPPSAGVAIGRTVVLSAAAQDARGAAITGLGAATFTSDNTSAARVDAAGIVTGVAVGSANVTATIVSSTDGAKSATAAISVTVAPPLAATVTMGAASFAPITTEISVGGTVTWMNSSGVAHDVDFGTPAMRIAVFDSGQRSLTFSSAGSFAYHCNLHAGMEATVVVR